MPTKKDLYKLTKEMLYAKFDGHCAFCGEELSGKWCIWDIEPRETVVKRNGTIILGNDSYENKLPACNSCNSTRLHHSGDRLARIDIEQFRQALYQEHEFLAHLSMYSTYYRKALKFGLIQETGNAIVFYFERG